MNGSVKQVGRALTQLHSISERRYHGDYGACDILIDLERDMSRAELTTQQLAAINLVYFEDKDQKEAAVLLDISQQRISSLVRTSVQKIARLFDEDDD